MECIFCVFYRSTKWLHLSKCMKADRNYRGKLQYVCGPAMLRVTAHAEMEKQWNRNRNVTIWETESTACFRVSYFVVFKPCALSSSSPAKTGPRISRFARPQPARGLSKLSKLEAEVAILDFSKNISLQISFIYMFFLLKRRACHSFRLETSLHLQELGANQGWHVVPLQRKAEAIATASTLKLDPTRLQSSRNEHENDEWEMNPLESVTLSVTLSVFRFGKIIKTKQFASRRRESEKSRVFMLFQLRQTTSWLRTDSEHLSAEHFSQHRKGCRVRLCLSNSTLLLCSFHFALFLTLFTFCSSFCSSWVWSPKEWDACEGDDRSIGRSQESIPHHMETIGIEWPEIQPRRYSFGIWWCEGTRNETDHQGELSQEHSKSLLSGFPWISFQLFFYHKKTLVFRKRQPRNPGGVGRMNIATAPHVRHRIQTKKHQKEWPICLDQCCDLPTAM